MKIKRKNSAEVEFLKYFFENAPLSTGQRIILEEGFESCFNTKIPPAFKINLKTDEEYINSKRHPDTEPSPPPKSETLKSLPLPPKLPTIPNYNNLETIKVTAVNKEDIDNLDFSEYVVTHKGSGEHVSLSQLIIQLKFMTGTE